MKIEKPNILDYGITEEEYSSYKKSEEIRNQKSDYNLFIYIIMTFLIILLLYISGGVLGVLCATGDISNYDIGKALGRIGFWIALVLASLLFGNIKYKHKIKKIDKKADALIIEFSNKKIEMLKKYDKTLCNYNKEVNKNCIKKQKLLDDLNSKKVYLT